MPKQNLPRFDYRTRHPRVERLEDRRMLAGVTVGNTLDVSNGDTSSIAALIADDGGDGISLREAITAADNTAGADVITFAAGPGEAFENGGLIRLASGRELDIVESLTIDASAAGGAVTISGDVLGDDTTTPGNITDLDATAESELDDNVRVIDFSSPSTSADLVLRGLTITGGVSIGRGGGIVGGGLGVSRSITLEESTVRGNFGRVDGGGISAVQSVEVTLIDSTVSENSTGGSGGGVFITTGDITLVRSSVSANNATGDDSSGGGIYTISGGVMLISSTVNGNTAAGSGVSNDNDGGGGVFSSSGDITLRNSTVSGNTSADDGGGVFSFSGEVSLISSTVANNTSAEDGGGVSIGGNFSGLSLSVRNSIVAGNTATDSAPDLLFAPGDPFDIDFSLIGNTSGSSITAMAGGGNLLDVDPLLGDLADNGGSTLTHALLPGSPAFNAGDPAFDPNVSDPPLLFDQRGDGFARIQLERIDIGAVEFQPPPPLLVTTTADVVLNDAETSLREAINFANSQPGADTITFASGVSGIISIGSELLISDELSILGPGRDLLTINANGPSRVFNVNDGSASSTIDVEISGLTISGGDASSVNGRTLVSSLDVQAGVSFNLVVNSIASSFETGDGPFVVLRGVNLRITSSSLNENLTALSQVTLRADSGGVPGAVVHDLGVLEITQNGASTFFAGSTGFLLQPETRYWISVGDTNGVSGVSLTGDGFFSDTLPDGAVGRLGTDSFSSSDDGNTWQPIDFGPQSEFILFSVLATPASAPALLPTLAGRVPNAGGGVFSEENLTISDARVTGNEAFQGGGLFAADGQLTIVDSVVDENTAIELGGGVGLSNAGAVIQRAAIADNQAEVGGGLAAQGNSDDFMNDLSIAASTISGNTATESGFSANYFAGAGGGLFLNYLIDAAIVNSTISSNSASEGGGVLNGGGRTTIDNATITENTGGGFEDRSFSSFRSSSFSNSIFAGNDGIDVSFPAFNPNAIQSRGHNLVGSTTNVEVFDSDRDQVGGNIDPLLGPLADNGGPTLTHALLEGSPAVDAGDPNLDVNSDPSDPAFDPLLLSDQRGLPFLRIANGRVDIGAFERQPINAGPTPGDYNRDLIVNAADFVVFRDTIGAGVSPDGAGADGDGDGMVTIADYLPWARNFGQEFTPPMSAAESPIVPTSATVIAEAEPNATAPDAGAVGAAPQFAPPISTTSPLRTAFAEPAILDSASSDLLLLALSAPPLAQRDNGVDVFSRDEAFASDEDKPDPAADESLVLSLAGF